MDNLEQWTEYEFCVRCGHDGSWGKWSDEIVVKTKELTFSWKRCPSSVDKNRKVYSVDEKNPRIATKMSGNTGAQS